MSKGTPVWDHVLKVVDLLGELETLDTRIDGETRIDFVPQFLLKSSSDFDSILIGGHSLCRNHLRASGSGRTSLKDTNYAYG